MRLFKITRWTAIYFALALIDLLTIMGSLALNHHTVIVHHDSVEQSQVWAGHLERTTSLSSLAQRVNAPGNDVFDTLDVISERARRNDALEQFWTGYTGLATGLAALPEDIRRPINVPLEQIRPAMLEMVGEADEIFTLIAAGDTAAAGRHMATMDRKYADLTNAIGSLSAQIQSANSAQLGAELARASALQRWEYLFGAIVFVIITLVAVYGHRMGLVMDRKDRELRDARDEAERANKQKSEFLANMSHEIRTPLNGILGMATLLDQGNLKAEERKSLRIIRESGDHLLATINDILDLSKIEAGHLEIETTSFKPHDQLSRLERLYTLRAREKGIEFNCEFRDEFDPLTDREGDPTRISQILHNLISNAIKFTDRGEVKLTIGPADHPDSVRFSVSDTGCGLSAEQEAKIFDPFVQAEASTTRRFGGTGLGLAIVNQLVERMGGTLSVESRVGHGSTFEVVVPLPATEVEIATTATPAVVEQTPKIEIPAGLKILIVDDNLTNRLVASGLLSGIQADISFAEDGLEAVMAARTTNFDMILMDINMPNMDGFEALRMIRMREEEGLAKPTTVFALTASVMSEQVDEYRVSGFDGLLAKPLQQHLLLRAVREAVEGVSETYWNDVTSDLAVQVNGQPHA